MLRTLRQHPLLVGMAEVLTDAARYVAIVLVVLMLLGQMVRLAALGS
jgi:MFS-type transporter involved in bile tolerance (Atg22 family)